jgi:chromatin segregation and condensation protein Rec8/ScpA/Scc1 (kleisin family)
LLEAFGKVLEATGGIKAIDITVDSTPQKEVMDQILARIAAEAAAGRPAEITLTQLIKDNNATLGRLINLFLSLLELVKEGFLRAVQHKAFGEIYLLRRTPPATPAPQSPPPAAAKGPAPAEPPAAPDDRATPAT